VSDIIEHLPAKLDALVPADLAETSITVDGRPAPMLYAQDSQVNFIVPWSTRTSWAGVRAVAISSVQRERGAQ
jgi:uncharacterized protein (TIGR03437 family)